MPTSLQILSLWTNAREESCSSPLVLGQGKPVLFCVQLCAVCVCVSGLPTYKSIPRITTLSTRFTSPPTHSQAITEAL